MPDLSRRRFLGLLALAGAGVACSNGGGTEFVEPRAGLTFDDVFAGRPQDLKVLVPPYEILPRSTQKITIVLQTNPDGAPIRRAEGQVWLAKQRTAEAVGPFDLRALEDGFNDRGVYGAEVEIPEDGTWLVLAEARPSAGAAIQVGVANLVAGQQPTNQMPRPGDRAIPVVTPTVRNARGVDPICTLQPEPCSMHRLSLDTALDNAKPTVLIIGTPRFCTSQFCGPEVQIVDAIARERSDINFVHVEVLKDDKDETVQAFQGRPPEGYRGSPIAPAARAWNLAEEPVIYFIDAGGVIQARLLGAVDGVAIRDTLGSLAT